MVAVYSSPVREEGTYDPVYAFHEAAHAIVITQFGLTVTRIELNGFRNAVYHTTYFVGAPTPHQTAVIALAGSAAEAIGERETLRAMGKLPPAPPHERVRFRLGINGRDMDTYSEVASLEDSSAFQVHAGEALWILEQGDNWMKFLKLAAFLRLKGGILSNAEFLSVLGENLTEGR